MPPCIVHQALAPRTRRSPPAPAAALQVRLRRRSPGSTRSPSRGGGRGKGPILRLSSLLRKETETKIFKGSKPRVRRLSEPSDLHSLLQLSLMGEQIWAAEG